MFRVLGFETALRVFPIGPQGRPCRDGRGLAARHYQRRMGGEERAARLLARRSRALLWESGRNPVLSEGCGRVYLSRGMAGSPGEKYSKRATSRVEHPLGIQSKCKFPTNSKHRLHAH